MTYEDVVASLSRDDVIVLDVRSQRELVEKGQIPGTVNIPCKLEIYTRKKTVNKRSNPKISETLDGISFLFQPTRMRQI